jgi:hypothetical protein
MRSVLADFADGAEFVCGSWDCSRDDGLVGNSVSLMFKALLPWTLLIERRLDLERTMFRFEMKMLNINTVTTKNSSMPPLNTRHPLSVLHGPWSFLHWARVTFLDDRLPWLCKSLNLSSGL